MAQVQNRFAGHISPADPRSLLFSAKGSVWPTIPAFRYRAQSDNATGAYSFFNGDGLLLELFTPLPAFENVQWFGHRPPPLDHSAFINMQQTPVTRPGFVWVIGVSPEIDTGFDIKFLVQPLRKTNVDIEVGSIQRFFPEIGDTGSTFRMRQVVWDQTMPPD